MKRCRTAGCPNRVKRGHDVCAYCWQLEMYEDAEERDDNPEDSLLTKVLENPAIQGLIDRAMGGVNNKIDELGSKLDRYVIAWMAAQQMKQQQQPSGPKKEDPRIILGFPKDAVLTKDMIKARQRELAKIYHSDKGGSDDSMQRINEAVDALLKEVKD